MKTTFFILVQIVALNSFAQNRFNFKEIIEARANDKLSSLIQEGDKVSISGIGLVEINSVRQPMFFANKSDGSLSNFVSKEYEINLTWQSHQLLKVYGLKI